MRSNGHWRVAFLITSAAFLAPAFGSSDARLTAAAAPVVRAIYVVPQDRAVRSDYYAEIKNAVTDVRTWYFGQLAGRTFRLYQEDPEVCRLPGTSAYYEVNTWDKVMADIQACAPVSYQSSSYRWVLYADVLHACGAPGGLGISLLGVTMFPRQHLDGLVFDPYFDDCGQPSVLPNRHFYGELARAIGYGFGLEHPPGCDTNSGCDTGALMWNGYGLYPSTYLTSIDKQTLSNSPAFTLVRAAGDFDDDSHSDLVFQNTDGQVYSWFLNGLVFQSGAWLAPDPVGGLWKVVGTPDVNGDRKPDLLWQHDVSLQVIAQTYDGTLRTGGTVIPATLSGGWRIVATGDFNRDEQDDVVLHDLNDGRVMIWLLGTNAGVPLVSSSTYIAHPDLSHLTLAPANRPVWRIAGAADFNNDGSPDLLWQNISTGTVLVWLLDGTTFLGGQVIGAANVAWRIRAVGDYFGDSRPDLVWQNLLSGSLYLWTWQNGTLVPNTSLGSTATSWQLVGAR